MKNTLIAIAVIIIAFGVYFLKNNSDKNSGGIASTAVLRGEKIVVYKSPTCGCCGKYVSYLEDEGVEVDVVETEEMSKIKAERKVPRLLESCHTSVIGGYTVEGHVPVEAIRKLLDERPAIAGISLAEMPAGSPGMGGTKLEQFDIRIITLDGKDGGTFMRF